MINISRACESLFRSKDEAGKEQRRISNGSADFRSKSLFLYGMVFRCTFFLFFCCFLFPGYTSQGPEADRIIGQWMSVRRNVKVQVYREANEYKARVIWFNDSDDKSKPMNSRLDEHNPDPKLRQRKILGMQVLSRLKYNPKSNRWEKGKIYDAKTGREWSSVATLTDDGLLYVKGYWQFEFIGKTMKFRKVS
jgi:uncharacterized protein (DUF2147 family)